MRGKMGPEGQEEANSILLPVQPILPPTWNVPTRGVGLPLESMLCRGRKVPCNATLLLRVVHCSPDELSRPQGLTYAPVPTHI